MRRPLHPRDVELALDVAQPADRLLRRPALFRVDDQCGRRRAVLERRPHQRQTRKIRLFIEAHPQLRAAQAIVARHRSVPGGELLVSRGQRDAARMRIRPGARPAERLPQGFRVGLGLQVPERDVQRGDRRRGKSLSPTLRLHLRHAPPDRGRRAGICAHEHLRHEALDLRTGSIDTDGDADEVAVGQELDDTAAGRVSSGRLAGRRAGIGGHLDAGDFHARVTAPFTWRSSTSSWFPSLRGRARWRAPPSRCARASPHPPVRDHPCESHPRCGDAR